MSKRDAEFAFGDSDTDERRVRLLRSSVLAAFSEAAKSLGLDPFRMLRRAGLSVAALDGLDYQVPRDRLQALLADCAKSAASEDFGLLVGGAFRLSIKSPLGQLMREQPTVRAAVEVLRRYLRYQDDNAELRTAPQPGGLMIMPEPLSPRSRASRLMVEMTLAITVQMFRGLLGEHWRPVRSAFAHPAPANDLAYRLLLGRVEFEAPVTGFLLTNDDLATPLGAGDPHMAHEIAGLIEARGTLNADISASETVSALILCLLPDGECGVDLVAEHLGVDRRTVHRRLATEGKSFTALLELARQEVASRQLSQGDQPLSEVATMVGFSSLSSFSRWFHQTSGVQPSEYRRRTQPD